MRAQAHFIAAAALAVTLTFDLAAAAMAASAKDTAFDGYEMRELGKLPITQAHSVMLIIGGFLPPIEEPLDTRLVSLDVSGDGDALVVNVETRGYQDDSILGENFRARFEPDGAQWRIVALGRQVVCARGAYAGQPARTCP